MIVAVCSLGGSPGVTTLAAALAACWPATPLCVPVLVEADASGGDMAVWHRRSTGRGLASLAAASRRLRPAHDGENPLLQHAMELESGVRVVTAASAAHEAAGAVHQLAQTPWLMHEGRVVVLDVGRISPGTPGVSLLTHADAVVVAVREDPAQLMRLAECAQVVSRLEEAGVRVGAAVVPDASGPQRFSDREIGAQIGLPVWTRIPHDSLGAAHVRGEELSVGRSLLARARHWLRERRDLAAFDWMPLMRTARSLAERLDALTVRRPGRIPAAATPVEPVPDPVEAEEREAVAA